MARHSMIRLAAATVAALLVAACEPSSARLAAPADAALFARPVFIGTDVTMGAASGGVAASTQGVSWPAILAGSVGATIAQPLFRAPGCTPPLVSPLMLGRRLSSAVAWPRDSSCAGASTVATPPTDNVAIAGASAWAALNLSPKLVAAAPATFDVVTRAQYPLVLGNPQTQVTAMLVRSPTFVSVELGSGEVLPAAMSGRMVAATAATYGQPLTWTYVPAAVASPVLAAIADSVAKSGARAVWFTVPHVGTLAALRSGAQLAAERTALAGFGVQVAADCDGSTNVVALAKVFAAATKASAGPAQVVSCADVPGAADQVLTAADVQALDAIVDAMNAQIRQLVSAHGWALADLDAALASAAAQGALPIVKALACDRPFGYGLSLDGVTPSASGQATIAVLVAESVNATYKTALPVPTSPLTALLPNPCP